MPRPAPLARLTRAMEPWVFLPAAALVIAFVAFGGLFTATARTTFEALQAGIVEHFGWFYILTASTLLYFGGLRALRVDYATAGVPSAEELTAGEARMPGLSLNEEGEGEAATSARRQASEERRK